MDIDVSVGNFKNSSLALGGMGIYFLNEEISKDAKEYANGPLGAFDGFAIIVTQAFKEIGEGTLSVRREASRRSRPEEQEQEESLGHGALRRIPRRRVQALQQQEEHL